MFQTKLSLDDDSFQWADEYRWKLLRSGSREKALNAGAFATDLAVFEKVLPPNTADFMDRKACEDFNEFINVTGPDKFYITLPPKLRGAHRCRDPTPSTSTRHRQPTPCNMELHPLEQVRLTRIDGQWFQVSCARHGTIEAYASDGARFTQDFHSFRARKLDASHAEPFISTLMPQTSVIDTPAPLKSSMALTRPSKRSERGLSEPQSSAGDVQWEWESPQSVHERYREELFGATRLVPRKHSVQFSSKYRWHDTSESPSHNAPAGLYKIGDMQAQMLLPPNPEDYMDPEACEAFNRYVQSSRPERLYALIPPMSSALPCEPVQDMTGLIPGSLCTTEMPAWSQTELSLIDGTKYSARCLYHRPLADHVLKVAQQEKDFHHFRMTEAEAEMKSAPIPLADDQSLDTPWPTPMRPDATCPGLTATVVPDSYDWFIAKPESAASTSEAQTWSEDCANLNEVYVPREGVLDDLVEVDAEYDDSLDAPHDDDDIAEP